MNHYNVHLSKTYTADIQIEAESRDKAEEIAFYKWNRGEIELMDSGIPGDVDIEAKEADMQTEQ